MTAAQVTLDAIRHLSFGQEAVFEDLTMIPILSTRDGPPDYLTLDEALHSGTVQVTEVDEAGHVPELAVAVKGDLPVLLLDGEELIGAKQNRVLNLTILAPARRTTVIPVSCVEAGRWHRVSRDFTAAARVQFSEARAAKMSQVTTSLKRGEGRRSDQGAVWNQVADKLDRLGAASDTSAMSALFELLGKPLDDFVAGLPAVDRQVGAVFLIDGEPVGLDLFDHAATWKTVAPKLIRSYAVDAIDRRRRPDRRRRAMDLPGFLSCLSSGVTSTFPAAGEGEDVRLSGDRVQGAALVASGRAIHLSAFTVPQP